MTTADDLCRCDRPNRWLDLELNQWTCRACRRPVSLAPHRASPASPTTGSGPHNRPVKEAPDASWRP